MAFEINFKILFQDFNPSKFLVYSCLLLFSLLFALKADGVLICSYWVVFLPIWIWKCLVLLGATVGSCVWWRNPSYRMELDSYVQYKAMIICTGAHALLLMFELLACDKLENDRPPVLWILVFIPLIFMSLVSIGICVWAVKHERAFEMELFCSANILQFVFVALRLDEFLDWSWVIVMIPLWIVMCVALIGVLYAVILALILLRSPDIIPQQRRSNLFSALGYMVLVVPLLVFEILLVHKADGARDHSWVEVCVPLYISLVTLLVLSFASKPANQWWFGLRRELGPWLLGVCPLLQEYGNIAYKGCDGSSSDRHSDSSSMDVTQQCVTSRTSKQQDAGLVQHQYIVSLETPD